MNSSDVGSQINPILKWVQQLVSMLPERDARKLLARRSRTEINLGPNGISLHRGQVLSMPLGQASETPHSLAAAKDLLFPREKFVLSLSEPHCFLREAQLPAKASGEAAAVVKLDIERLTPFRQNEVVDVCSLVQLDRSDRVIARHGLVKRLVFHEYCKALGPNLLAVAFRQPDQPAWQHVLDGNGAPYGSKSERFWSKALLASAVLALFAPLGIAFQAHRQIDARSALLESEIPALQEKAKAVRAKLDQLKAERSATRAILDQRNSSLQVTRIWAELTTKLPDGAWIQSLTLSNEGGQINGWAESAESLIELLERSSMFSEVRFSSPLIKNPGESRPQFSIAFKLEQRS